MGTRSVVAVPTADGGWKGRYIHWDGSPSGAGAALAKIVRRDGYDTAVKVLTQDHYGWSTVNGKDEQPLGPGYDNGRFIAVPGYGVAYSHTEQPDEWITHDGNDWGTEYVYVLHPDSVRVIERVWERQGRPLYDWRDLFSRKYTDYDAALESAR